MKKVFLFLAVSLGLSSVSFGQGIPVYDNAQIISQQQNFVKQMTEIANQLQVAKDQFDTAQNQLSSFQAEALEMKKRMEGVTGFVNNFSVDDLNKTLDAILKDVDQSYIDDFVQNNNLSFDDEQMKKNITRQAELHAKYDALTANLKKKDEEISKLREKFNSATTPQQREEISNSIALEKSKMDNIGKTAEYELKKAEIENATQKEKEYNEYMSTKFGGY